MTAAMVSCGHEQKPAITPSGKTIKVGIIAPFSGSDFAKGKEGLKGAKTALKMQPLLRNGDRIEIITRDDQDEPVKAVKALRDLVKTERVAAVVTFSSSGPVLAMAGIADTLKTPILAALATHPDVTKNNGYVSQVCFDNTFQGQIAALFARDELLVDSAVVFKNPNSLYSSNLAAEFEGEFALLGGEITDVIVLPKKSANVTDILKGLRKKDPELLYLPVAAKDVITIIQATDQLSWKPKLMSSDGLLATVISQYKDQLGLLDGILATDFFYHGIKSTHFGERAGDAHEGRATTYTALGVECFAILIEAMSQCNDSEDRECIRRRIRSTKNFEGILGNITIGTDGKAHRPVVINAIKNSKLHYVVKVY